MVCLVSVKELQSLRAVCQACVKSVAKSCISHGESRRAVSAVLTDYNYPQPLSIGVGLPITNHYNTHPHSSVPSRITNGLTNL